MTHSSRKRSRLCEDESCEFMPISKRINKLHIRSGQLNSDDEGQEETLGESCSNGTGHLSTNGFLHDSSDRSSMYSCNGQISTGGTPVQQQQQQQQQLSDSLCNGMYLDDQNVASTSMLHDASSVSDVCDLETRLQTLNQLQQHEQLQQMDYQPDLNEDENPYYYQVNEMLFHLHSMRLQRLAKNQGCL